MKRPWMPLYIADYLADTGHLRAAESGAYLHLIMHYWQRGSLPDDDRQLASIARMTPDEWGTARPIIEPLFLPGWKHKRIDKELIEAERKYEKRAAAGRKGVEAKLKQNLSNATSNADSNAQTLLEHPRVVVSSTPPSESLFGLKEDSEERSSGRWNFEEFWKTYPHKVGKQAAHRAFDKAHRANGVEFEAVMVALRRYVAKTDDRPWCNPETWLNQGRWEDEPANGGGNGISRHGGGQGGTASGHKSFASFAVARAREASKTGE